MAGKPWSEEHKQQFREAVIRAHQEGKYVNHDILLSKQRFENREWRSNQRAAASKKLLDSNPMKNNDSYQAMVEAKRNQFSGYELPKWYAKQGGRPVYNKRMLVIFDRLCKDLCISKAYYGPTEKKFGRYWADFYIPDFGLVIDWNEAHHDKKDQVLRDTKRIQLLRENNPDLVFLILREKDHVIDGYTGEQTYQSILKAIEEIVISKKLIST